MLRVAPYNTRVTRASELTSSVPAGRVLALDVGAKRIGVAISDELRMLARGLETIQRTSKRVDFETISSLVREYRIAEVVVGHPVRLSGDSSAQTEKVLKFADELRPLINVPIRLCDERLTSIAADEILGQKKRSVKQHIRQRKSGEVDRIAAVVILQGYLDSLR